MTLELFLSLLTAVSLGALIGTEREMKKAKLDPKSASFAGLRTHLLVSLIGFSGALMSQSYGLAIPSVLLGAVVLFFFGGYLSKARRMELPGITSELSGVLSFLVGAMSLSRPLLAAILAICTVLALALKDHLHHFVRSLSPLEFLSAVKFIIVAFVVLPVLPKEAIDPWGLIVPFEAWLMVVLVSAISFIGYALTRAIGARKSIGLLALVGGLASSTATTISLAQQGRKNGKLALPLAFGVCVASAIMLLRALAEVAVVNRLLLPELSLTLGAMIGANLLAMGVLGWRLMGEGKGPKAEEPQLSSPFRLWPALQFGLLYIGILALAQLGQRYFGHGGVYAASAVSGLADVDAITLSLSNLAHEGVLPSQVAAKGITLAVMVNTAVKLGLVRVFGSAELFRRCALALGFVVACGGVAIWLW